MKLVFRFVYEVLTEAPADLYWQWRMRKKMRAWQATWNQSPERQAEALREAYR